MNLPPDPAAFTRQVLAAVHTLTLTTVGPILADGDAPCFADGPIGIKRATLVLLATLAPERWNACSLTVFDQDRSAVITADDAPPIQPPDEYRHRFDTVTLAAPEAPARIWRADVARLVRTWRSLRGAAPYLRCRMTARHGSRLRLLLMPAETARPGATLPGRRR